MYDTYHYVRKHGNYIKLLMYTLIMKQLKKNKTAEKMITTPY